MGEIKVTWYPEQAKSIAKIIKSLKRKPKQHVFTDYNVQRLKNIINEDIDFIVYLFSDDEEDDDMNILAEELFLNRLFLEEDFLRLLAKSTLTNRIVKAYHSKEISDFLKYRVRECAAAYELYNSFGGSRK